MFNMSLLLRTRVSGDDRVWGRDSILVTRDRTDSNYYENRVLSINIQTENVGIGQGDDTPLRGSMAVTVTPLISNVT